MALTRVNNPEVLGKLERQLRDFLMEFRDHLLLLRDHLGLELQMPEFVERARQFLKLSLNQDTDRPRLIQFFLSITDVILILLYPLVMTVHFGHLLGFPTGRPLYILDKPKPRRTNGCHEARIGDYTTTARSSSRSSLRRPGTNSTAARTEPRGRSSSVATSWAGYRCASSCCSGLRTTRRT